MVIGGGYKMDYEAQYTKIFGDPNSDISMTADAVEDGLWLATLHGREMVVRHLVEVLEEKKLRQISLVKLKLILQSQQKAVAEFMAKFD
jgi:hypothetical protein